MENSFQRRSAVARFIDLAAASTHRMALRGMLLIAACSTTAPHSAPPSQAPEPSASPSPPPAPLPAVASAAPAESPLQAFERMRDDVGRESVFFDFDKSDIQGDQVSAITDNEKR